MAQSTAEEVKEVANKQAEQILNEAKANAKKEVDSLENEISLKKHELDDAKKEFMEEADIILHDLIRSNPQLTRRLMKFIFKNIVEQNGPNFSISTSAESFDKIVDNFKDIENIDPDFKEQAYNTFDVALRAFIDSAKSLGSKNTLIAAMYDSMHTTEPINKDEDNSWESCNITIR